MTVTVDLDNRPPLSFYLSVGLVAGSIIALQIGIMRVFSVGSWAHFGSLVVSLAMFGFGLTSAVMCVGKGWFERHWEGAVKGALLAFGPLMVVCNLAAQQVPFNAIFLISDPMQKWRLAGNFLLYMLPFLAGALYLGTVFLKANKIFGRVYFADLSGAGLCGLEAQPGKRRARGCTAAGGSQCREDAVALFGRRCVSYLPVSTLWTRL